MCEKSRMSFLALYLPANNLPIDLAQASAESPTDIVHTPSMNDSVFASIPLTYVPSASNVLDDLITSMSGIGWKNPLSVPVIGLKPTPHPCSRSHRTSTTSYTVSTFVNEQLNCEDSLLLAMSVPPSHRVLPEVVTFLASISCLNCSSSSS